MIGEEDMDFMSAPVDVSTINSGLTWTAAVFLTLTWASTVIRSSCRGEKPEVADGDSIPSTKRSNNREVSGLY